MVMDANVPNAMSTIVTISIVLLSGGRVRNSCCSGLIHELKVGSGWVEVSQLQPSLPRKHGLLVTHRI